MTSSNDTYLLARAGDVLAGRYRVLELLGVGAMGSVWLAEQIALRGKVVVKFHESGFQGMSGQKALTRFHREVRALSSVKHVNVTELYESGTTDRGEPYIIMERLEGQTLARRMRDRAKLDPAWVCAVAVGIGHGLEAVHRAGVLHRDVKPENIFLHRDDDMTLPKLLDFGLAREEEAPTTTGRRRRVTGRRSAIGTPGYMSPEQALAAADLDTRVDQYALAVCVYEMLTGDLPARGEDARELLHATVNEHPVELERALPDLDRGLAEAVMRALSRDREGRFPTIRDFYLALDAARARLSSSDDSPADRRARSLRALRPGAIEES